MRTLSKFLVFSFVIVLAYTAVELYLSTTTGISHDTVTTCLYTFFGTEIGSCAFIQIVKTIRGEKNDAADMPENIAEYDDIQSIDNIEEACG